MPLAEVRPGTLPPGAQEIVVQSRADQRTRKWNEPPRPFFYDFCACLRRDTLDDARHESADYFFLQQLAADVHTSGAGGCDPQFSSFLFGVEFEPIDETKLLNGSQRDARQNPQVGNDGDQAAQAKAGALGSSHFHSAANHALRQVIQLADIHVDRTGAVDDVTSGLSAAAPIFDVVVRAESKGDRVVSFMRGDGADIDPFELVVAADGRAELRFVASDAIREELALDGIPVPKPFTVSRTPKM